MTTSLLAAGICLLVLVLLPVPKVAYMKDPIRGILTGLTVAGIGIPLCLIGSAIGQRFESSPYFEGRFIAGFLSLAGYVCICIAAVCIGLAFYALISRYLKA